MAKNNVSLEKVMSDLKSKIYHPVYFFTGDEPYYIDRLTEYMMENVIAESEKAFNQSVIYGKDGDSSTVLNAVRRYPMMAAYQLVVLKEAQELKNFEDLVHYIDKPLKSTLFVINYKYKSLDKRKKIYKVIEQNAVVYESEKFYEDKIPGWISRYLAKRNYSAEPKAALLLTEFLGNDLSKISNELDKLIITAGDSRIITSGLIEQNIGISKDYNNFELQNALSRNDILKANLIINFFAENQKNNHITQTITNLYYFFSKILIYHTIPDKSSKNIASQLKINPFFVKEYEIAARNYSYARVVQIVSYLREYDLKSKGFGNVSASPGDLLKELMFKILH